MATSINMTETDSDFASNASVSEGRQHGTSSISDAQSSMRSRGSRFTRSTRAPSESRLSRTESKVKEKEKQTKSIFQWNEGGRNVYLAGSWDNYKERVPMESLKPGSYRVVLPIPSNEKVEYVFFVDGERRVAQKLPSHINEKGEHVNVKHAEPTIMHRGGRVKNIISKISGVDLYSPFQGQQVASMLIFRLFYLLTIPAAIYYFYWLLSGGGNEDHPFIWLTYVIAEIMSLTSAVIGLFSMWGPVRRK